MLYGRILRCPHAHARLKTFDSSAASKIAGVKSVIQTPLKEFRFAGSPVAAVAAITPEIAQDAVRAIVVEYEVLPHVVRADDAIKAGAPKVVEEESNLQQKGKQGDPQKAEAAFKDCDAIIEAEYRTPSRSLDILSNRIPTGIRALRIQWAPSRRASPAWSALRVDCGIAGARLDTHRRSRSASAWA